MKGKLYSEDEILDVLGKVEAGQSLEEVARSSGVAKSTIHPTGRAKPRPSSAGKPSTAA